MSINFAGSHAKFAGYALTNKNGTLPVTYTDLKEDSVKDAVNYVNGWFSTSNRKLPAKGHELGLTKEGGEVWAVLLNPKREPVSAFHNPIRTTETAAAKQVVEQVGKSFPINYFA